jgi:Acetyltransferase (GNAT) domain
LDDAVAGATRRYPPRSEPNRPAATIVRRARPGDEPQLIEGSCGRLAAKPSVQTWDWWFQGSPAGPAIAYVLEARDRIVGHVAHVTGDIWIAGERCKIGVCGYVWVARGFQGASGFRRLVEASLAKDHGLDLHIGFTSPRLSRLYEHLGLGPVVGSLQWWSGGEHVEVRKGSARRAFLGFAAKIATRMASFGPSRVRVKPLEELGPAIDELANDAAAFAPCVRVRDSAYLQWRWLDNPSSTDWRISAVHDRRGGVRGWVVFGPDPKEDRGVVVDLLSRDAKTTRALLLHATRELRAQGLPSVWLPFHDPRPWARRAMIRAGFLPRYTGQVAIVQSLTERAGPVINEFANWYLTYGDTDTLL